MVKGDKENIQGKIEKTLDISEIGLVINSYNDIFSVFDPRPYSQRSLSVDFLDEAERASKDKPLEDLSLNFLIRAHQRDLKKEGTIKKRLKEHFGKHFGSSQKERKIIIREGLGFIFFGIVFMFVAVSILYEFEDMGLLGNFLVVLLQPAGWFLFWEGLNLIIFEAKKTKPKVDFYKKMSECNINFFTY